jgi:hypothetical protein
MHIESLQRIKFGLRSWTGIIPAAGTGFLGHWQEGLSVYQSLWWRRNNGLVNLVLKINSSKREEMAKKIASYIPSSEKCQAGCGERLGLP